MSDSVNDFAPIRPAANLTDQVTRALVEEITSGRLALGQALASEQSMAASFGVSRTVIREAISRLKAEGLITSRQGKGAVVASPAPQRFHLEVDDADEFSTVLQIIELRVAFETEAAALAAQRRGPEHLEEMARALQLMQEAIDQGHIEVGVEADLGFHRAVCAATGNPHFVTFFNFLSQYLRESIEVARRNSARRSGAALPAQREHQSIQAAFGAGDGKAARAAARRHVINTVKRLEAAHDHRAPE